MLQPHYDRSLHTILTKKSLVLKQSFNIEFPPELHKRRVIKGLLKIFPISNTFIILQIRTFFSLLYY